MAKIFVRGEKVSDNTILVTFQHFDPLSEKDGLTEEQLKEGYLVDNISEPDCPVGKISRLMYNVDSGKLFYDYSMDAPAPRPTLDSVNEKLDLIMQSILESEGIL